MVAPVGGAAAALSAVSGLGGIYAMVDGSTGTGLTSVFLGVAGVMVALYGAWNQQRIASRRADAEILRRNTELKADIDKERRNHAMLAARFVSLEEENAELRAEIRRLRHEL